MVKNKAKKLMGCHKIQPINTITKTAEVADLLRKLFFKLKIL